MFRDSITYSLLPSGHVLVYPIPSLDGALEPGRAGDLVVWPCTDAAGVTFAGALSDPVEALLRCGPVAPRYTFVAGRPLVAGGCLTAPGVEQMLRRHRNIAAEWLAAAG
jgi:hypothetical protein